MWRPQCCCWTSLHVWCPICEFLHEKHMGPTDRKELCDAIIMTWTKVPEECFQQFLEPQPPKIKTFLSQCLECEPNKVSSECTFTGNCEVLTTVRASATERLQRKRLDGASLSPCYMTVMSFTLEGCLTLWDLTLSPQWILTMKGHIIENMKIGFLQLELYFYWISFVPWSPKCRRAWSQGDGFRGQRSSLMLAQTSQG